MINIKSQKIVPSVPADAAQASFAIAAEDYFAVVSYESKNTLNTQVAQNIVTDILAHGLILEDANASLQVLEKTLKDCKEAWQKISEDVVFSAVLAWFKADFVYVSIYGNAKALYLDGTEMVHLDTEKEGHFAGGTQQIDDGKVMVLCTHDFFIKFPPKSLVSLDQPIAAQDLDDLSSAIILKVDKVAEEPSMKEKAIEKVKPVGRLPIRGKIAQIPVRRFLKPALIGLGVLILITGGYFLLKATLFKPKDQLQTNQTTTDSNEMQNGEQSGEDPEIQDELSKKLDEANKVRRVQPQVFYDISIADAKTNPGELAQGQTYLAVSDPAQGKIYISSKEVTKFEELPQLFPGVKNLLFDGDTLIFTDNEGVKFYALATKSVNKSYLMAEAYPVLGPSSEYLGFTYAISRDSLIKFAKSDNELSGVVWAQKEQFNNAVSLDIDGSIYVLFSNGDLEKYTAGAQADFSIVGLDIPIQKPLKVVTDAAFKQIYVADGEEGRLIAFDEDGILAFQLKPELGNEWTELKSFDISSNEKTFYVLSGTKVYEFSL